MKNFPAVLSGLVISGIVLAPSLECVAAPGTSTNASASAPAPEAEIPLSVFVIPATPREGRNPFFPNSSLGAPAPRIQIITTDFASALFINGITPNGHPRTVMINGRTFEQGEEGEVRTAGGKLLIKCEEIKEDAAIVSCSGQRRELHMRSGL